jgi:hypothetical protein
MGERFGKVKKTLAILLAVFFVTSLTAAAVSAAPHDRNGHDGYDHDDHYGHGHGHGNDWYHGDDWYRHHGYHWWRNHWWDDDWWKHNHHGY